VGGVAKLHSDETNEFDVRTASSTVNVNCRGWAATSAKKLLETKKAGVVAKKPTRLFV
jgi:urocanate hydratase